MRYAFALLLVASLLSGLGLLYHTYTDSSAWPQRQKLREALTDLQAKNDRQALEAEELASHIEAIRSDAAVAERVVRAELNYIRPGEVVIELNSRAE